MADYACLCNAACPICWGGRDSRPEGIVMVMATAMVGHAAHRLVRQGAVWMLQQDRGDSCGRGNVVPLSTLVWDSGPVLPASG